MSSTIWSSITKLLSLRDSRPVSIDINEAKYVGESSVFWSMLISTLLTLLLLPQTTLLSQVNFCTHLTWTLRCLTLTISRLSFDSKALNTLKPKTPKKVRETSLIVKFMERKLVKVSTCSGHMNISSCFKHLASPRALIKESWVLLLKMSNVVTLREVRCWKTCLLNCCSANLLVSKVSCLSQGIQLMMLMSTQPFFMVSLFSFNIPLMK